tara:strand:- start:502 stop:765 length:264 start_codon:yes stop_codon:yes gene_type:complete
MLEILKKSIHFSFFLIIFISGIITSFVSIIAIFWLISQTSNIFSGQASLDEYLLFFVVFNIVLTFAMLIFVDRNIEKKKSLTNPHTK